MLINMAIGQQVERIARHPSDAEILLHFADPAMCAAKHIEKSCYRSHEGSFAMRPPAMAESA